MTIAINPYSKETFKESKDVEIAIVAQGNLFLNKGSLSRDSRRGQAFSINLLALILSRMPFLD